MSSAGRAAASRGLGQAGLPAVTGAVLAVGAVRALLASPPAGADRWTRINHRGEEISLVEGPALALAVAAGVALAGNCPGRVRAGGVAAALGAGGFGLYDDLLGSTASKGFRGHLSALRRGEVTSGAIKIVGIGAVGLIAARSVSESVVGSLVGGAAIAGSANLLNLMDLRPGRALKVGLAHAPVLAMGSPSTDLAAAGLGAALGCLPSDLDEKTMLGDAGANALGALLGLAVVARSGPAARLGYLLGLAALTAASEKVSFSAVIDRTPTLRRIDQWGRRPPVAAAATPPAAAGKRPVT